MRHLTTLAAMLGFTLAPVTLSAAISEGTKATPAVSSPAVAFNASPIALDASQATYQAPTAKRVYRASQAPLTASAATPNTATVAKPLPTTLYNCRTMPLATGGKVGYCDAK